ncbi:hypothetical protein [Marispirochaeta sp.]|nr:hypothetical protein [Marispirochaeta sp.]
MDARSDGEGMDALSRIAAKHTAVDQSVRECERKGLGERNFA